jgi:LacI family transcriptional regulator
VARIPRSALPNRTRNAPERWSVTIKDVATAAGVSTATVSHALNFTGRINPETRQRVLALARELKYYPNRNASNLASHRSRTLGIIVSDIENPFFAVAVRSFEAAARRWRLETIVSETGYEIELMERAAENMMEQKVCGVAILTSEMSPRWLEEIVRQGIPIVGFDLAFKNDRVTNIKIDYPSGVRQVVEHLYSLGHRRMSFVGGRHVFKNILSREQSYIASTKAMGLDPGPVLNGNQRPDGGYTAGLAILELSPRPTAVVAMNDLTAVGLIKAFRARGLSVPGDISVTGFDNTYLAHYFDPRLTTVDMHPDALGRSAAEALREAFADSGAAKERTITLDLVVGESTGPAPESH